MFVLFRSLQMQLNALLRVSDSVIVCSRFKDRRQEQREQAGAGDGHQRSMCLIDQEETRRQYVYLANRGQPCYEKKSEKKATFYLNSRLVWKEVTQSASKEESFIMFIIFY